MAILATRERSAAVDLVWPPPEEELDALEIIDLRGPTSPPADSPGPRAPQRLRAAVPRAEPAPAPRADVPPIPALLALAPIQHATAAPAASQPVPARATWRARVPRLAAIAAMMLFAMSVGLLLGVRDARRSMTAGYSRLRESVVAVREYVEHVGTAPSAAARATPARLASTPTPARSRIGAVSAAPAAPSTPLATPDTGASPDASSLVAAPPIAVPPTPTPMAMTALPGTPLPEATPLAEMPNAMSVVNMLSTAPRAAEAAIVGTVSAEARVKQTLARYQQAYDTLDARAAAASWPSVDVAALTRAFSNLKSQSLNFDRCTVDVVSASTATASCAGSTTAVRQVGSSTPVTRSLQWTFNLRRDHDDAWLIDKVTTTKP
jgi:hypothetical protein